MSTWCTLFEVRGWKSWIYFKIRKLVDNTDNKAQIYRIKQKKTYDLTYAWLSVEFITKRSLVFACVFAEIGTQISAFWNQKQKLR